MYGSLGLEGSFQRHDPRCGMADPLTRGVLGYEVLGDLKLKVVCDQLGDLFPG